MKCSHMFKKRKHSVMAVYRCCMDEILFTRDSFCILEREISGYLMLDKRNIVLYATVLKLISYDLLVNYFTTERLQSSE